MILDSEALKKSKNYSLFKSTFKEEPSFYFDTGGRLEICGNHTDHNHGLCLVANCSLRIKAFVKACKDKVKIKSKGFHYFEFDVNDLEKNIKNKTCLLCKGVLFKLKELGYQIGGFEAYIDSDIPDGSGVSSSAAIESLFGYIISYLYNDQKIPPFDIAIAGKYSENNYFNKPSGLLDQIGTSYDSCNYIDFRNINNPTIKTIPFLLPLDIYLIKSAGNHSSLTNLYARIPRSMNLVANLLEGKKYLRDIEDKRNIFEKIDALNCDTYAKEVAKHFFIENDNVRHARIAIENNDIDGFLEAISFSQKSSLRHLKNTYVEGEFEDSPQDIINHVKLFLPKDKGAIRIHGGGFKGTVIAFIKKEYSFDFENYLKDNYPNRYYKVSISDSAINFIKL